MVFLLPNPKTNPGLDPNSNHNGGGGGNYPDTIFFAKNVIYLRKKYY